jgi:hypothetical protein
LPASFVTTEGGRGMRIPGFILAGVLLAMSACGAPANGPADGEPTEADSSPLAVEFRAYNLLPDAGPEFHRLVVEESLPLLARWDVDVLGYGFSSDDRSSYFLIRAFESLEQRQSTEDAFYGSDEWIEGPREAILALIDTYTTIVLEMDGATVEALRAELSRDGSSRAP